MNCMNCGRPTTGGAVLCRACAAEERARRRHLTRGTIALIVALCLTAALTIGMVVYLILSANDRAVEVARLRVEAEELDRRAYQLSLSEGETDQLTAQIEQLEAENTDLRQQIHTLDSQLGAADSERNQSTSNYIQQVADLEQQLRQMEATQKTLEDQITALQEASETMAEEREELETEIEELTQARDDLQVALDDLQEDYDFVVDYYRNEGASSSGGNVDVVQYTAYKRKADFLDQYIVFVMDDQTGYYHDYDCSEFSTGGSWWAYNRTLARSQGYTACPVCGGGS